MILGSFPMFVYMRVFPKVDLCHGFLYYVNKVTVEKAAEK